MVIDGPSFIVNGCPENVFSSKPIVLSLAQQIAYNTVDRRSLTATNVRHPKARITPFPMYVGIKTYLQSGHHMIDVLYARGIAVSYSVVKTLSIDIANSVIKFWDENGIVVPPHAKKNCFTTIGFDNIDWNAKAALSKTDSTIHGTILCVHQFRTDSNEEIDQNVDIFCDEVRGLKSIKPIPTYYNSPSEDYTITDDDKIFIPRIDSKIIPHKIPSDDFLLPQFQWLNDSSKVIQKLTLDKNDWISFAAYNANLQTKQIFVSRLVSHVMPLLLQKASEPSTVSHVLKIACQLTKYLNPGQVAVVETDQPLYQAAKKLQAKYPEEEFCEEKLLITLGSLHTEKMLWQMSGDLQDGSGIVTAFANSGIETFGTKTFLICNSITTTRHHKQILVLALEILKQRAFNESQLNEDGNCDLLFGEKEDFTSWLRRVNEEQPQAAYFSLCQEVDLLILEFIRACRISDLDRFIEALTSLMPYVFALDRTHYQRSLPLFLRDLMSLKDRHPSLYTEFKENGNFMGRKTNNRFSSIPIDQCTEHQVCWLKNEGGVIGNLDDEQTVRRHQASIPEMIRMVQEFEKSNGDGKVSGSDDRHHEMYPKFQEDFRRDVLALVDAFEKLGNPWKEQSGLLYELNESIVMPDAVVQNIRQLKSIGEGKFENFLEKRVNSQEEALTDTISQNNIVLFRKVLDMKKPTKSVKSVISERKQQQARVVDIISSHQSGREITTLSHESSLLPPSLTKDGEMFHGDKCDIVDCFIPKEHKHKKHPNVSCAIIDGAALVRKLKPTCSATFGEYIDNELKTNILARFANVDRIDLVFDQYRVDSIKNATRDGRGSGKRRKIDKNVKVPGNWRDFLSVSENKTELFSLISEQLLETIELCDGKQLFATVKERCKTNQEFDLDALSPCTHEEADTRMFVHAFGAALFGHKKILIVANDSDIIVLGVRAFVLSSAIEELWITYSSKTVYIPIHEVASKMEKSFALALPGFHAFTGCDTTSSFKGKGKKTCYATWKGDPSYTPAFLELSGCNPKIDAVFRILQKFVCHLYGEIGDDVDAARLDMLIYKGRDFDNMPPTSDALYQHTLRAAHQSGNIWSFMNQSIYDEKDYAEWGYTRTGGNPQPMYTTKPIISRDLPVLAMCGCESGRCTGKCKCKKLSQSCTPLCKCKLNCTK